MDCIGQPGTDSEFHADFKSSFSFFGLSDLQFGRDVEKFLAVLRMFTFFQATPLNNFTQHDSLRGRVSTTENEPKS